MKPLTPDQAYARLARLCSRTEYAPAQCLARMQAWGVPAQQAGEVLQRLVDERFVDESRFARAFTNDSVRFIRHGRIKIAYALRQKGVSANVIAEAMEPNVLRYEPHLALFVPDDDALLFYRAIARYAAASLVNGGCLYFEINPLFARGTADVLEQAGFADVHIVRDFYGRERFAWAVNDNNNETVNT